MRYRVQGVFQGRPSNSYEIHADSAEAAQRAAEGVGIVVTSVCVADSTDESPEPLPTSAANSASPSSRRGWSGFVIARRVTLALFGVWLASAVVILSTPNELDVLTFFRDRENQILVGSALGLLLVWVLQIWIATFQTPRPRRSSWLWRLAPGVFVLGVILNATHRDLAIRVWLYETELREFVASRRDNRLLNAGLPQRVGSFRVQGAYAVETDTHFHTHNGFFCSYGLAHRPEGGSNEVRVRDSVFRYRHLFGPWYRYESARTGPLF